MICPESAHVSGCPRCLAPLLTKSSPTPGPLFLPLPPFPPPLLPFGAVHSFRPVRLLTISTPRPRRICQLFFNTLHSFYCVAPGVALPILDCRLHVWVSLSVQQALNNEDFRSRAPRATRLGTIERGETGKDTKPPGGGQEKRDSRTGNWDRIGTTVQEHLFSSRPTPHTHTQPIMAGYDNGYYAGGKGGFSSNRSSSGSMKQSERARWTPLTRMLLSGEMTQERQKELTFREKFDRWMVNEGYRRM